MVGTVMWQALLDDVSMILTDLYCGVLVDFAEVGYITERWNKFS